MTGALLSFSLMAVAVRALSSSITVMEILAVRAGTGFIVMSRSDGGPTCGRWFINVHHPALHLFRNTIHLGAQYLWMSAVLVMPLAIVFSLEFTAPAWALLLAVLFSVERMTRVSGSARSCLASWACWPVWRRPPASQPAALLVLAVAPVLPRRWSPPSG